MQATDRDAGSPLDWTTIDLVVFDVDGTLYDQKRLRLVMLKALLLDAWKSRSLSTIRTLRTFRNVREALGEEPGADFMALQYSRTASRERASIEHVRALTTEWLEERPLEHLGPCRFAHVSSLFAALRAQGKQIAVLSDYPAAAKLKAMDLQAHPIVCATDPGIARLKPDPLGLLTILQRCGVRPDRALMIGDRFDRDGAVAERAGVQALIRSGHKDASFATFTVYDDPVFLPVLAAHRSQRATA